MPARTKANRRLLSFLLCLLHFGVNSVAGQEATEPAPQTPSSPAAITVESVDGRIKQVEDAADLDDEAKTSLKTLLQETKDQIVLREKFRGQTTLFDRMIQNSESEKEAVSDRLAALPTVARLDDQSLTTSAKLEQKLTDERTNLDQLKEKLAELEAEPARRQTRRVEIPNEITVAKARLAELEKEIATEAPEGLAADVRKLRLQATKSAVSSELEMLERELAAYVATAKLLPLRRDLAARQAALANQKVEMLADALRRRRQEEADALAEQARREAAATEPKLRPLALENQRLAEKVQVVVGDLADVSRELQRSSRELDDLTKRFARTRAKVEQIGLTEAIGLLLRQQRAKLPDLARRRADQAQRGTKIRDAQLELLELDEQRAELADIEFETREWLVSTLSEAESLTEEEMDELEANIRDLLERQKQQLDALIHQQNEYFEKLIDLDSTTTQLIQETREYSNYIEERVLWIRSTGYFNQGSLADARDAFFWLTSPANWLELGREFGSDAIAHAGTTILFLVFWGALFVMQRRLRRRIRDLGEIAERSSCQRFSPTLQTLGLTLLAAAIWPLLLAYLGWRLSGLFSNEFARGIMVACFVVSIFSGSGELVRQICRRNGLAECHFDASPAAARRMFHATRWFLWTTTPFVFAAGTIAGSGIERWQNSFGRSCFIFVMTMGAIYAYRVLHPAGPVIRPLANSGNYAWAWRLRRLWLFLGLGCPLALMLLTTSGYHYTAKELVLRLQISVWLMLALIMILLLLMRLLLVNRRRLAIRQAQLRREAAIAARTEEQGPTESIPEARAEEAPPDLGALSDQTRQLINVVLFSVAFAGLLAVWSDVLPALGIFERVQLWTITQGDEVVVITLRHVAISILAAVITVLATRNLPGLLQLLLLQRLPLDAGARYALQAVSRYAIIAIGTIVSIGALGFHWSQYQWILAAASVGIGFGLQEIFANFISGLIVLMERPIRVGDIVTVDNVTGIVSKIRIRATTLINWDNQEFIVPNKEFVTGRLLNWTLTNRRIRVTLTVGVAYGSDTRQARQILLDVVKENPQVLNDPEPLVIFEEFGDSTLNFVIRCHLPDVERRLHVVNELHMEIDRRFRAAGIEIAFPQRDLHLRSISGPIPVKIKGWEKESEHDEEAP